MDYDRFIRFVKLSASVDGDTAERATRATLTTLAERLPFGLARLIADRLQPELAGWLSAATPGQGFGAGELTMRIAERESGDGGQADVTAAAVHARAVLNALRRAAGDELFAEVAAYLPPDFGSLLAPVGGLSAPEFLERVSSRGGLGVVGAAQATEAVLETLAQRMSGAEVAELVGELPVELRAPLLRGKPDVAAPAQRMTPDELLQRVADMAGATVDQAADNLRAVLAGLRDALKEGHFYEITARLPIELSALLPRP